MDYQTGAMPTDLDGFNSEELVSISERARLCKELLGKLPVNDFGLPVGIYRPDILPQLESYDEDPELPASGEQDFSGSSESYPADVSSSETSQSLFIGDVLSDADADDGILGDLVPQQKSLADSLPHSALQAAYVSLNYDEGYPTLPHGMPLWAQFPFEPPGAYELFQAYLKQARKSGLGVRMLSELPQFAASYAIQTSVSQIHEYYHLYYWGVRARAFDMFETASLQKQQELRALQVTDTQYNLAGKAMKKIDEFMENEEDFWDMMTPKTIVDLLKAVSAIQRTSVGLPANGPPQHKPEEDPRGTSMEFILRQIAQKSGGNSEGETLNEHGDILNNILSDADSIGMAQELILRMHKHG